MYLHLVWNVQWSPNRFQEVSPVLCLLDRLSVSLSACWDSGKRHKLCCRDTRQRQPSPSWLLPVSSKQTFPPRRSGRVIDRSCIALEEFPQMTSSLFDFDLMTVYISSLKTVKVKLSFAPTSNHRSSGRSYKSQDSLEEHAHKQGFCKKKKKGISWSTAP